MRNYDYSDPRSYHNFTQGRFFQGGGAWGAVRNTYFGGNSTTNLTPRDPEAWVTETPSAVTSSNFTFTVSGVALCDDDLNRKAALITDGTGASADWINITAIDKSTGIVTVDSWDTQPDTSSTIEIIDYIANRNTGEQWMMEWDRY